MEVNALGTQVRKSWKNDERGLLNPLLIPVVLLGVAFAIVGVIAIWAYGSRQDYKDNSDKKVAIAVTEAKQQQQQVDAKLYAEEAKKPLDTYIGPSAFGNITVKFPKTWSAYVVQKDKSSIPVDGFFHPAAVPDTANARNAFALRVQLLQLSYDQVMEQYSSLVESKKVKVSPISLPKVPSVVGSRIEGQIVQDKRGVVVVLPLRNMTLKIATEANEFKSDLDKNVLPNFIFQP